MSEFTEAEVRELTRHHVAYLIEQITPDTVGKRLIGNSYDEHDEQLITDELQELLALVAPAIGPISSR